jgi:hypothetical protein
MNESSLTRLLPTITIQPPSSKAMKKLEKLGVKKKCHLSSSKSNGRHGDVIVKKIVIMNYQSTIALFIVFDI